MSGAGVVRGWSAKVEEQAGLEKLTGSFNAKTPSPKGARRPEDGGAAKEELNA